jgi:hypothetical protein
MVKPFIIGDNEGVLDDLVEAVQRSMWRAIEACPAALLAEDLIGEMLASYSATTPQPQLRILASFSNLNSAGS